MRERDLLKENDDERINGKALWVDGAEDGLSAEGSLEWLHCLVRPDDASERPGILDVVNLDSEVCELKIVV